VIGQVPPRTTAPSPRKSLSRIFLILSVVLSSWAVVGALWPFFPAQCELLLLVIADCWSRIKRNDLNSAFVLVSIRVSTHRVKFRVKVGPFTLRLALLELRYG